MIRSMTAFAAAERATPWGHLGAEMRAVNHRYLEITPRLPEELRALETVLREKIASRVQRGKIDFGLRFRINVQQEDIRLNEAVLEQLARVSAACRPRFPGMVVGLADVLAFPGVIETAQVDTEGLQREAVLLMDALLEDFTAGREREGDKLKAVMVERLDGIARVAEQVRGWLPEIRAGLRAKFDLKLADLKQPLDPGRIEQEVVLTLQKLDVDEELDRLTVHIGEARRILDLSEAVGRRLDFLMQEFNREANTLGSKSVDARTSQAAVELKVLIEQLREQVQNIE